ncbi:malic enzyme-like NAD(P)-binding protein [Fangia hongkongensis]|uniref:malic enzyme-like NAD(P)-binding protein n=1 Tax=Fangia hongkongensis TaxID=270495 RepID=UPI00036428A4|nr:malic enzyme-like NAD(P)-binding protein [Fangia hongkongensis]MBK2126047.1 malate dehydrogenase [Fangia hongkongensis]
MNDLAKEALEYHEFPKPGKLAVEVTKPTESQKDLALAYTPGVAVPVREIAKDEINAYRYTNKGNLVGVISNGTAILGLGNLGALASKPVMEGKAVLFKKFADIDVFDIEVNTESVSQFIRTVENIAPTFGGINLEDIKAPECFQIEYELKKSLNIPVFHDDQHGTAIVVAAGLLNALEIQGKDLESAKIVCLGAGAAGLATLHLLIRMGARKENITVVDSRGVIHVEREALGPYKFAFARRTEMRTLDDAIDGADVFIGVSGPDLFTANQLKKMAAKPIVFALSNPDPEIKRELALQTRDDLIMATGRSDYPNQVNNVICFPYIFRGALDVKATKISMSMCIAAVKAIQALAKEPVPQHIVDLYPDVDALQFGPEYIIPKPMDPRLRECVSKAVSNTAIKQGIAQAAN